MIFADTPTAEAEGAILVHAVRRESLRFAKGRVLSADDVAALQAAGVEQVTAARLEPDDVPEDAAATALADAVRGAELTASAAFTGRCNLFADRPGLLVYDPARLDAVNMVDEAVTIAALAPHEVVAPKQMVATVKIIPFAAPQSSVERCAALASEGGPLLRVAAFGPLRAALLQTTLPGTKPGVLDKTREVTAARMAQLGGDLVAERRCPHATDELATALAEALRPTPDLLLIAGASAITDRRDVVPAAIERAGGRVDHFGMPVDPGNLLLLGTLEPDRRAIPVLGLPGCARSPKLNGFDWVLERIAAGIPVSAADIKRMGVGGLLKEIQTRPLPRGEATPARAPVRADPQRAPRIAAVVLAAGASRRMGAANKLLAPVAGTPMVRHAVEAALASQAGPVIVVTGHEASAVEAALEGLDVVCVRNPRHAEGLSTSLAAGLAAVPADADGAAILLGDMPRVAPQHIDKLIAAFSPTEGRAICVATCGGKRGNPVLWARGYFAEMADLAGDVGARRLLRAHGDAVAEVAIDSDAVLTDVDTPAALAALDAGSAR